MAENKEKILINITQSNYDGVFGFGEGAKVWQCTKAEAIETMANAICNMGDEETWGRVDDNYKHYCTAQAEWALNALMEGK